MTSSEWNSSGLLAFTLSDQIGGCTVARLLVRPRPFIVRELAVARPCPARSQARGRAPPGWLSYNGTEAAGGLLPGIDFTCGYGHSPGSS